MILRTVNRRWLDVGVVVIVALVGLLLIFQPLGLRVVVMGSLVVLALASVVVEPWLASSLLRWPLFGTLGFVAVAWAVRGGVWGVGQGVAAMNHWGTSRRLAAEQAASSAESEAKTDDEVEKSEASSSTSNAPDAPPPDRPATSSEEPIQFSEADEAQASDQPDDGEAGADESGKEG
ncbi:MAG: hypothetical protein R3B96_24280 [Pirellulaceae bacterium]